jgi:hypothetical protein
MTTAGLLDERQNVVKHFFDHSSMTNFQFALMWDRMNV